MADGLFEDYVEMVMDSVVSEKARAYLEGLLAEQKRRKKELPHKW